VKELFNKIANRAAETLDSEDCTDGWPKEVFMARMTFSKKGGRVRTTSARGKAGSGMSVEDVVRDIRKGLQKTPGEDYRERSLAIHGLICARCAREFDAASRHLLTVHHKDGNHDNNPADGSNWENLCVYCHDDVHSRGLLGSYLEGTGGEKEGALVYSDVSNRDGQAKGLGRLGDKLMKLMKEKKKP
jgi:hypothetical protein